MKLHVLCWDQWVMKLLCIYVHDGSDDMLDTPGAHAKYGSRGKFEKY